jgi:hypothetical protein
MRLELAGPRIEAMRILAPSSFARHVEHAALTAVERELAATGTSLRALVEPAAEAEALIDAALNRAHAVMDLHDVAAGVLTLRLIYEFVEPDRGA